jgi:hypothetical protein
MKSGLRKLAVLMSSGLSRDLVCESCGSPFQCGASLRGCWCSEIQLTDETRAQLKGQYRECLCRECLEKLAAQPSAQVAPQ